MLYSVFMLSIACVNLPKIGAGQEPNVFIRTNLIRMPKAAQAPLVLSYTEVNKVRI